MTMSEDLVLIPVYWKPEGTQVTVPSRIAWDSSNPMEIIIEFGMVNDDGETMDQASSMRWVFGRDLLLEAEQRVRAGLADVQVEILSGELSLSLNNGETAMTLCTEALPILAFVRETYLRVDLCREGDLLPLTDEALAAWLTEY
jgi:hypothetical protein